MLLGNKADLVSDRQVSEEEGRKVAQVGEILDVQYEYRMAQNE